MLLLDANTLISSSGQNSSSAGIVGSAAFYITTQQSLFTYGPISSISRFQMLRVLTLVSAKTRTRVLCRLSVLVFGSSNIGVVLGADAAMTTATATATAMTTAIVMAEPTVVDHGDRSVSDDACEDIHKCLDEEDNR